jgi:hypothetical protein
MPVQRRISTRPFERPKKYIIIDPDGNRIPFDNPRDAIDFGDKMKKSLQPDFSRQLDSLKVISEKQKIDTEQKTSPFKTKLDSLNVLEKQRDLKKPFFAPSHTPMADVLTEKVASGTATPEEIDRYNILHPKANAMDLDYTDVTRDANLSGLLSETTPSVANPDSVVYKVSGQARQTVQDLLNKRTNMRYFKLKADEHKQRGIPVSNSADEAQLFARNNAIVAEMKAAFQAGKIPVQTKAALEKIINDRMIQETGIPYEEHRQMINDLNSQ